jgi:hypothetical protein
MKGWLPKKYLSNSQIECVLTNPERYCKKYFEGIEEKDSPQITFGKAVTDILEGRVDGAPELVEQIRHVPRYAQTNVKLFEILKRKKDTVGVVGYMDAFEDDLIIDYKTSGTPWTQTKLEEAHQFKLYSLLLWTSTKKIPRVKIINIPTEKVHPEKVQGLSNSQFTMRVCGDVKILEHRFSLADLLEEHGRVFRAYDTILELSKNYEQPLG